MAESVDSSTSDDAPLFCAADMATRVMSSCIAQGRQFPVEVLYLEEPTEDYADAVLSAVFQIHKQEAPGDMLCFLTGQEEIENLQHLILERWLLCFDFSCLSCNLQNIMLPWKLVMGEAKQASLDIHYL